MADGDDYQVGYKKPPISTRFKPGQSGNPKGRPKKVKDLDKLLDNELSETIRFSDRGESRSASKREVLVKSLVNDAIKGDRAARKLVVELIQSHKSIEGFEPDAADHQALMDFLRKSSREDSGEETHDE